ncbi:LuxR C-terminal-related transcriptional regulator [Amycolatopsis nigrescens]|uniref:LuxR C-terminal-related transcriptional regulator n=1 Tax=Amycolatopsis nigrescens TaxID=381445 RepID=UPI00039BB987|nr:LuxR C-terminal-related transcriptional regulator [Amycolatopsis nigrescens]
MDETGFGTPDQALARAFTVLNAPICDTLPELSSALDGLVPHRAAAMLTGDCSRAPLKVHGAPALTEKITSAELGHLVGTIEVGRPWLGEATLAGRATTVLAVASAPPESQGALLVLALSGPEPGEAAKRTVQRMWDLTTLTLLERAEAVPPEGQAENRVAASERARAIAELGDAHAAALTGMLGVLRSKSLDDVSARRGATDLAVAALIELRSAGDRDRALSEEPAGRAFDRLAEKLLPLTKYSDVHLELVAPEDTRRGLPAEIANAARAAVRAIVLAMLEQSELHRIRVAWQVGDESLRVAVRDDGPGRLVADALTVHRLGERLGALEGTLAVDAVENWGTTVTATLPLAAPELPDAGPLNGLNPRELEVLTELTRGHRNRQIAEELHISEHTVKFHVANILGKLDVGSRGEAAAIARGAGRG